ncbi:serine/threonine protein kinase, putative [Plasmodium vivax]|uniref:non-specific serine/threonine protein kinase n=1 Tax=Plasmodium vivax (strain Salvador I) TaxID=126793 RepID=A5KAE8_PLAVS|nr:serine/threonine protein kinase, putative [Plasmodium vivax]EDL43784.1 serine/threonine protein kinase, putative [Plasmodium vivax]|eukprot:XP_001613511.1 serine/threonine protein kinase [Plasmodium vivax Sal-1]
MIETTGKVEYSKSKTIPCDGSNDDDEEEANNYLPLKYEKTLDLEKGNELSGTQQSGELASSPKGAKSKGVKGDAAVEPPKMGTLDEGTMETTSGGGTPFDLNVSMGMKKALHGDAPANSSQAGNGGLPQILDHLEEETDNMYSRKVASTKYYGTGSSGESRDNEESGYPKGFSSPVQGKKGEGASPYGVDADGVKHSMAEASKASKGGLPEDTYTTNCSNLAEGEKDMFAKMMEEQAKKSSINGGHKNGEKESNPFCMTTGKFSKQGEGSTDYNNAYVHGREDNSREVASCHQTDGEKECLANCPDALMGGKWNEGLHVGGHLYADHHPQDEDKCSTEDVVYMGMQTSGSKAQQCEGESKNSPYVKKEDLKTIACQQDIFNDTENANDSTTECSSSVKDIPQLVTNHPGVYANRVGEKEVVSITSGYFASYTDGKTFECKNSSAAKGPHSEKEKESIICDDLGFGPVVSNAANNGEAKVEGEKNAFAEAAQIAEVGGEPSNGAVGRYLAAGHTNKALCAPGVSDAAVEKKCVVSEKRGQGGPISIQVSPPTSGTNINNGSRNFNSSKRDSLHGEARSPNEALYKKKSLYPGKEVDSMKKKNETTLRKSQLMEYPQNENEESLEEYFKSTIPENILRNIKYENPSNTYNDMLSNNGHYDLTSELRNSNPTSTYYASGRGRDMGEKKSAEVVNNSGVASPGMNLRSRAAGGAASAAVAPGAAVATAAPVAGGTTVGGRDAYHVQADKGVDAREDPQAARKQNNGGYSYMGSGYMGSGYNGGGYTGSGYNASGYNASGYNASGYNGYYSVEKDPGMATRNTRVCNEPESNYASGKRYYLLPPKKCDAVKEQKNQMLMISKQKIKKIWNKFKNGASKEQNLIPTFENEHNLFPNMEVLHGQKVHAQIGGTQMNAPMNASLNAPMNAQINASLNAQLGVPMHPQVTPPLHGQLPGQLPGQMHSEFYGVSGPFQTCSQGAVGIGAGVGAGPLMSPFKECINKPIRRGSNVIEKQIKAKCIFNWKLAQKSLLKMLHSAHNYYFNGVEYADWQLTCIPTLGFSKSSNRVQQMYKAVIPSKDANSKNEVKLFLKKVPIYIWIKQYNLMSEYDGEYVTDGENFVMEATSLAFLNEYHPGITPKLHRILYEPDGKQPNECNIPPKSMFNSLTLFNDILTERLKCNISGNIVIVSEFFSEDILDFIDRRQKKLNMKINNNEKSYILYQCLKLLIRLHDAGLSHLDLTPENILISDNYEMRLCDLSKSTPIYTYNLRHIKDVNRLYLFESCEPTIAKGAYMPPECWKIYWKYDTMKIKNPLKDLKNITDQEKRKQFYFDVSSADKFMLGVFFFWIWTNGNLWKCSDPLQDEDFFYFVKCDMNFDKFELTRKWPTDLKNIIKQLLHVEHRKKLNLKDLSMHPWWSCKLQ